MNRTVSRNGNILGGEVIILDMTVDERHPEWSGYMHVGVLVPILHYKRAPFAIGDMLSLVCEQGAEPDIALPLPSKAAADTT